MPSEVIEFICPMADTEPTAVGKKEVAMRYGVVLFMAVALSSGAYVLGSQQTERPHSVNQAVPCQNAPPTPPYHRSAREAKPLPKLVPASNFTDRPLVFKAYQIAHEIPFVLAQQPCYCRCDKEFGHGSLLGLLCFCTHGGVWDLPEGNILHVPND